MEPFAIIRQQPKKVKVKQVFVNKKQPLGVGVIKCILPSAKKFKTKQQQMHVIDRTKNKPLISSVGGIQQNDSPYLQPQRQKQLMDFQMYESEYNEVRNMPEKHNIDQDDQQQIQLTKKNQKSRKYNSNSYYQQPIKQQIYHQSVMLDSLDQQQIQFNKKSKLKRQYRSENYLFRPISLKKPERQKIDGISEESSQLSQRKHQFQSRRVYDSSKIYPPSKSKSHVLLSSSDESNLDEGEDVIQYMHSITFKPMII